MVKKTPGRWRMYVDYTDLNMECPKNSYLLPNIDKIVDNSSEYQLLSFMDAYSVYNQMHMFEHKQINTMFMIENTSY